MFKKPALLLIPFYFSLSFLFPRKVFADDVVLSLDPASGSSEVSVSQQVNVVLDSGSQEITVGDIYLEYDSSQVSISQSSVSQGEQGYGDGLCDFRLKGVFVDDSKVRFGFSCEDDQGVSQPFSGQVVVGKFSFTPLVSGVTTTISLKYLAGATAGDCNAVNAGVDYLTGTEGGSYDLVGSKESPTHKECDSSTNTCVSVAGDGEDLCAVDADCAEDQPETHLICIDNQCALREGYSEDDALCLGKYENASCGEDNQDQNNDDNNQDEEDDQGSQDNNQDSNDNNQDNNQGGGNNNGSGNLGGKGGVGSGNNGNNAGTSSAVPHTAGGLSGIFLGSAVSVGLILLSVVLL